MAQTPEDDQPFLMPVNGVFHPIPRHLAALWPGRKLGRAVLVTGVIERGSVRPGDEVAVVGLGVDGTTTRVAFVAAGRSAVGSAGAGTNAGLVLQGQVAGGLKDGQVLATPGSAVARSVFAADIALLPEESSPADLLSGDRLGFYLRTASVPGVVTLPHGLDVLRPMHTAAVEIDLDEPVALAVGQRFAFRHRGRAAGSGTVTRILPGAR